MYGGILHIFWHSLLTSYLLDIGLFHRICILPNMRPLCGYVIHVVSKPSFCFKRVSYSEYGFIDTAQFAEDFSNSEMHQLHLLMRLFPSAVVLLRICWINKSHKISIWLLNVPWYLGTQTEYMKPNCRLEAGETGLNVHHGTLKMAKTVLRTLIVNRKLTK